MNYILLLSLILLSACGTVKKRPNIVPFDSNPRGLKVTDKKGNELGQTPFFLKVDPNWSNHYNVIQNNRAHDLRYECKMNWGGSIVPDSILLPFAPSGTIVGTIFLLTDWFTGGIYRCVNPIHYDGRAQNEIIEQPKRILPLPFKNLDRNFSEKTHSIWQKSILPKFFKDKDQIIWEDEVREFLFMRGISHYKENFNIQKIRKKYLYEIAHKFQATHFTTFEIYHQDKNYYTIKTRLWDAFTLKEVIFNKKPTLIRLSRKNEPKQFKQLFVETISFIPNSLLFSYKEKSDMAWFHENEELMADEDSVIEDHPDSLPKYFTFIGMETVQHPQFFDDWDYGLFFSPSFEANSARTKFKLKTEEIVSIDAATYHASYIMSLKGFSPFGSLSFGIGPSLNYLKINQSNNQTYDSLVIGLKFGAEYHFFFGERWYFTLGTSHQGFEPKAGKHDPQYKLDGVTSTYVGLGYYFPSIRNMVRNLLN